MNHVQDACVTTKLTFTWIRANLVRHGADFTCETPLPAFKLTTWVDSKVGHRLNKYLPVKICPERLLSCEPALNPTLRCYLGSSLSKKGCELIA